MPANNKNYISIGVSVRTTKSAARNNGIGVRQESNPQSPTVYSSVRYGHHKGLRKKTFNDRFSEFNGGHFSFRADNFTRRIFPRLTVWCLREKTKRWLTAFRGSTESFSFRQRILKNCSADSFSGFDSFAFHFERTVFRRGLFLV